MESGIVFDIKEFSVHDGPGIRTTVFLKGCPLACMWCHNPESQSAAPQRMCGPAGERLAGTVYTAAELAELLNRQGSILKANEGGVTFSGGEPLRQAAFVEAVIARLDELHVLLDTSGFGDEQAFRRLLERVDLVYYDIKLVDPEMHRHYTGASNTPILRNLRALSASGVPFVIRVPLVPGVTDTDANLGAVVETIRGLPGLVRVDMLPYNLSAGAKYAAAQMRFNPDYDETLPVNVNTLVFEQAGIKVCVA